MAMLWWKSLKKTLSCKSRESCDVIKREDSRGGSARGIKRSFLPPPPPRSGCSRSISNLRDVIHSQYGGSRRRAPAAVPSRCDSPRSIESSDVLNALTQDVLLAAGAPAGFGRDLRAGAGEAPGLAAWAIGGAAPLSPLLMRCSTSRLSRRSSPREVSPLRLRREAGAGNGDLGSPVPAWASCGVGVQCDRCGGLFSSNDALESHHLVYHAVTELVDGDTASKVVELIYKVGWPSPQVAMDRVERVVKVHNMDRSVDRFKEYMEEVKARAAQQPNKHPRCIADGNELLQFHGTTVSCSLGAGGSHSVCASGACNVCRIIRHGFSATRENRADGVAVGVFTTSTSKRALECLQETNAGGGGEAGAGGVKHALIVCRAVAGRIRRPLENPQDAAGQPGFDSVAGQVGADSSIEGLYLLNPSALLPCFVVICKA
ncbi:hypothetical protein C2845_PM10G19260 [Panicum miliaceum]|uniref:C2H2-type domain-containing protein n=1 Tax=Panicum miliaceum TaxID=4540 RepID=A0A3L6PF60_PANMI|nr:hypothetical protein C2845_PM10G19260 [Panicum miliaceum]